VKTEYELEKKEQVRAAVSSMYGKTRRRCQGTTVRVIYLDRLFRERIMLLQACTATSLQHATTVTITSFLPSYTMTSLITKNQIEDVNESAISMDRHSAFLVSLSAIEDVEANLPIFIALDAMMMMMQVSAGSRTGHKTVDPYRFSLCGVD